MESLEQASGDGDGTEQARHPIHMDSSDNDSDAPPAKKVKRHQSTDSLPSQEASDDANGPSEAVPEANQEIPDSEADDDDEIDDTDLTREENIIYKGSQTDLEVSLPSLQTDDEAIAAYEASKAAENATMSGLEQRLDDRNWVRGRSSIYVDAFNLALETVLQDEQQLFDEPEMAVFQSWKNLSYEAQYLYVRLFLRKTAAWHRISRLGYYDDIADLVSAIEVLQTPRSLPKSSVEASEQAGDFEPPEDEVFGLSFSFADRSEDCIDTLEEASSLLSLEELKTFAKDAKVHGKTKVQLLRALRSASRNQSGLGWGALHRTESQDSTESIETDSPGPSETGINRDQHFVRKIMNLTGPCVRLATAPLRLFERVHLAFYRSTEWTEKSLTTIILAKISRRNFPEYIVSRSANIFPDRATLLEFEAAIRIQYRVDAIMEFNGPPTRERLREVLGMFELVYPRWRAYLEIEQQREENQYESGEGAYLRRFSPAWVYTRIIHKGAFCLGKVREHLREHKVLAELLQQKLFHTSRRGAWYQRKALIEEHYIAALAPNQGRDIDAQKRFWKQMSLATCEQGLQDSDCHVIFHHGLQTRITKLEKMMRTAKRQQHDFGHVRLLRPVSRIVKGVRVVKTASIDPRRPDRKGGKTVWIDEHEGGRECSVEEMCLSVYRSEGWKGYHSEGGIIRTLFAYLFYDILFLYVPNVFQTSYQTCPLDLHTDTFFASRMSEISHRLVEIANGEGVRLIREVDQKHRERETCVVGLDWSFTTDDLIDIVECFNGEALATICKVMAQEYRQRGGGIPDLFLWHPEHKAVMFSEVKSENDRLSDTQKLWIHVLTGAGVHVEVCGAITVGVQLD